MGAALGEIAGVPRTSKHEPGTMAIHADDAARDGAVVAPITQATTFAAASDEAFLETATRTFTDDFYVRYGTPNHTQVADVVAALEGADAAIVTASGMGAITTIALALLRAGDHVVVQDSIYPGTTALVATLLDRFGVTATTADLTDPTAAAAALAQPCALVLAETPSNPYLGIVDVTRVAHLAHACGALLVVDSTIATPINQRPLELGADLVWHSATKYLGGHSDVSAGVVAGRTDLIETVWRTHLVAGAVLGPFDAWLLLRGLRTLELRMARHNASAMALATLLEHHPAVARVHYPGLGSHPARPRGRPDAGVRRPAQLRGGRRGAGRRRGPRRPDARHAAASLGSVHTLATRPAAMWGDPRNDVAGEGGVPAGLIRLAVGIESTEDLAADLRAPSTRWSTGRGPSDLD